MSEAVFSFRPQWSGHEQRTLCFLADQLNDDVYFYADVDLYPLNYVTKLQDQNNMIVVSPDNPQYAISDGAFGTYYIRVRPSYTV
jgi:hypothetical protein